MREADSTANVVALIETQTPRRGDPQGPATARRFSSAPPLGESALPCAALRQPTQTERLARAIAPTPRRHRSGDRRALARGWRRLHAIMQELVRFDMQLMENPEISGVEYQQGTLVGCEVREYLLAKWGRKVRLLRRRKRATEHRSRPSARRAAVRIGSQTWSRPAFHATKQKMTGSSRSSFRTIPTVWPGSNRNSKRRSRMRRRSTLRAGRSTARWPEPAFRSRPAAAAGRSSTGTDSRSRKLTRWMRSVPATWARSPRSAAGSSRRF